MPLNEGQKDALAKAYDTYADAGGQLMLDGAAIGDGADLVATWSNCDDIDMVSFISDLHTLEQIMGSNDSKSIMHVSTSKGYKNTGVTWTK